MERIVDFIGIISKYSWHVVWDQIFIFVYILERQLEGKYLLYICITLALIYFRPHPSARMALLEIKYSFLITISKVFQFFDLSAAFDVINQIHSGNPLFLWFCWHDIFSRMYCIATTLCSRCFDSCFWRKK